MLRHAGLSGIVILLKMRKGASDAEMCLGWLVVVGLEGGDHCDYLCNEGLSLMKGMRLEKES